MELAINFVAYGTIYLGRLATANGLVMKMEHLALNIAVLPGCCVRLSTRPLTPELLESIFVMLILIVVLLSSVGYFMQILCKFSCTSLYRLTKLEAMWYGSMLLWNPVRRACQ